MPELTPVHFGLLAAALLAGIVLGWIFRSGRSKREKIAGNAGWQAQIDSQQSEHDRLADQNKSLMEQINQYQASNKDAKNRAKELSDYLKEAFTRRERRSAPRAPARRAPGRSRRRSPDRTASPRTTGRPSFVVSG